jgi:glycosyltransferase involved in cell wall biosynthesis
MLSRLWLRPIIPRVSVVVPLFNHALYIEEAIASVLTQGAIVLEVVVIDDGSTDNSAAAMERLVRWDKRITFTRQTNQGAHAAINAGLANCTGDLLTILNSDDAYTQGRLAVMAGALDRDEAADIAVSGLQFMNGAGAPVANAWYGEQLAFYRAGAELGVALLNGNFVMSTSNLLFRRRALEAIGPFAPLRYVHDLDWMLRALALDHRIIRLERDLIRYRIHGKNTISEDHGAVRVEWAIAAAAYLATLWDRPGAAPIDWEHAGTVQMVLRRHQLDRAVSPCMAYLRRHGATSLDRSPLPADAAFKAILRGWV